MSTTTTVSRAAHGSLRAHVSSHRECLGECFNAPLQARKAASPIPADAAVPMGPMQPAQHVASATSKGTVTTVFPHARTLRFAVSFPMDHVVSHDAQVAREEELRKPTCAATPASCTELLHPACPTVFPLSGHRGDLGTHDPTIATPYERSDLPMEGRLELAGNHGTWTVPEPRSAYAMCMLGSLPQVGEEHPEVRDLALRKDEQRRVQPPAWMRHVPEGTPRSWLLAACKRQDALGSY